MGVISIYPLVKVFVMGQEVCDGVSMAWDVFELVVKVLEVFYPSGLSASCFMWFLEILEVLVIRVDFNGVCGA